MPINLKKVKKCRVCQGTDLAKVVDFGRSAIADDYFADKDNSETYPLAGLLCSDCGLFQLDHVVEASAIYDDYIYVTSSSPGLNQHFGQYAQNVSDLLSLGQGSKILDIGCNDGVLLKHFKALGCQVAGVEPAGPIAQALNEAGITTTNAYWTMATADNIIAEYGRPDVITTNNVFANVDDIASFGSAVKQVLPEHGVWVVETGYHYSLVDNFVFDNIYHEHLSYFSVHSLSHFFAKLGMRIFHVEKVETKGGSIRVFATPTNAKWQEQPSVQHFVAEENAIGLFKQETYVEYMARINRLKAEVHSQLQSLKQQSLPIVGFGASATTTTVLYVLGIAQYLDFLVDDNPIKQGTFSPGFRLPVKASDQIPDHACVVILPWRFADMFIERNRQRLQDGVRFLKIIPTIEQIKA